MIDPSRKEKKKLNVSFSSDTKDDSRDTSRDASFDHPTFDTSFDSAILQYAADAGSWDGNLFANDDPFLTEADAMDRFSSQQKSQQQQHLNESVSIKIEERLSIFFDQMSSSPTCRVVGSIGIIPKPDMPDAFCLTIRDKRGHIEQYEPSNVCRNVTGSLVHLALEPEDQIFQISLDKPEAMDAPLIRYYCVPQLTPMPMLLKTKVKRTGMQCQVGIRIRANPKNRRPLEKMVIMMVIPPDINGNSAVMSRKGGLWDDLKRILSWTHDKLHAGEFIDIRAQFQCADLGADATTTLPILVRCDGRSLFSRIEFSTENSNGSTRPVKLYADQK
eukprot:CAMPEP_0113630856 /NCGR_PEP_ID=MMETSP0017_2-20120614/16034_1 /TAXON_ID=2856 /ORGANISM="Cylindrotheca closterium" /LENGTH=330 /DNA_ID=CAMNT_0000541341 /DNA_START=1 /DNA_END=990 /DNA_ORIENTATION=- /assembly_acc=CAM_ASM_000147